ncbi:MAG: PmoA family protein [Clostridia bacterium]|nr:PmoA family protein [Clostridia bacterium]
MKLTIKAVRDYRDEPVLYRTEEKAGQIRSAKAADGRVFPAGQTDEGILVIATLARGEEIELETSADACRQDVEVTSLPDSSRVSVKIGGKPFTEYVYDTQFCKPYLGPVLAADGKTSYTRMDLTAKEHPHQRSIICAIGDINDIDFWNEYGNYGYERQKKLLRAEGNAAAGVIEASIVWQDKDGVPQWDEIRKFTVYNQGQDCRYLDAEFKFTAAYGDVVIGPTKEAGPLGIRMNEQLNVDHGTGFIFNAYGAENESECWGKSASYCAYNGTIDGHLYGIAVFDNENNIQYPTAWHVRNYGLFAANNFYFKGGMTLKKGQTLTYRYRIVFYEGEQVNLADRFNSYEAFIKE